MGKPSKSITPSVPLERSIRTRSSILRKKSADESFDNQMKPFFQENYFSPRDFPIVQSKPKFFPNHEDIDIYFASCFNSNFKNKEEGHQILEKEINEEKKYRKTKKPKIALPKQDVFDEAAESQVKSSLASIEEENEPEKPNFDPESQSPESPIFGRKMMKNLRTPPNKLVDLKDFDQSEEIVRKNFIDQLQEVSKEVSSPSDNRLSSSTPINPLTQIINNTNIQHPIIIPSIIKTQKKRISKKQKTPSNKKKPTIAVQEYFQKPESVEFSFRRHSPNTQAKRRAQILRLSTLKSLYNKYTKAQRSLMSLENAVKTLMNYYKLRQLNTSVLTFRSNVYKLLKQFFSIIGFCREEIDNMMRLMRDKKEICAEVIQEKAKGQGQVVHYFDEKMMMEEEREDQREWGIERK